MNKKRTKTSGISPGTKEKTPYELLDIPLHSSSREIRKAYLKKLRAFPPEKDPEAFKEIKYAYDLLKDAEKRKTLDFSLIKTDSGIIMPSTSTKDISSLFRDRIFHFLLASSDFYNSEDFSQNYLDIKKEIKNLR